MNKNFERNPRRIQEIRCRPYADNIYRKVFGDNIQIKRFESEDNYLLDKEFAIDVIVTLPSGLILTGQEKFLSEDYADFRTVTIEYMQNPATNEKGDWFKMAVQFYFCGYEHSKSKLFYPWVLLDWSKVVMATKLNLIEWTNGNNNKTMARASFKYTKMDNIPKQCIIACNLSITP